MTLEHTGRPWPHHAAAAGTVFLLELVVDGLATERFDIDDGACPAAFVVKRAATIRTGLGSGDENHLVGVFCRNALPPVAMVSRSRSAGRTGGLAPGRIGFDGQFRRRSRGAEESFPGGAFLITQAIFEPSVFFPEAINLLLLLQAVRAITQAVKARG